MPGFSLQGQGQGEGLKVREKMLTLPEGTVIAYKKKQLIFENNGWGKQRLKGEDGEGASASPEKTKRGEGPAARIHLLLCAAGRKTPPHCGGTHIPPPKPPPSTAD